MRDFERNGLNLPEEDRDEVRALQKEIAEKERNANDNINSDNTKEEVEEKFLEGLP